MSLTKCLPKWVNDRGAEESGAEEQGLLLKGQLVYILSSTN